MIPPANCPLCGSPNQCAVASGSDAPCWCLTTEVSAAALAALPGAQRNQVCLCPACARGAASTRPSDGEAADAD